jgi:parallel beta-helix repeat protein
VLVVGSHVRGMAQAPAASAARTHHVAQLHPAASDENTGTPDAPFQTISRAALAVQPGDTVIIDDGLYRERVVVDTSGAPDRPISFQAAPMAKVVVTGAERIAAWTREEGEDNVFSTDWPHEYLGWAERRAHPDDDYHLMIGRAEQVHVNGYSLLQVLSRDKLSRGTFLVDLNAKRLYLWDRANRDLAKGHTTVEASVRQELWRCQADYVQIRGVTFRYACNGAQQGAVQMLGDHTVLEDCVVERTNGSGAVFAGRDVVVRRCVFRDNGWSGFDATAENLVMTGCLCENNNTKDWNRGWGAVNKLVLCRNAIIEDSTFRDNHGHGIWLDIGNENCTVRNCLIINNDDAGIFYEISYGLHAHDNVIIGNGLGSQFPSWGANGGISISNSPHCVVERNLIIANKEGLQFRDMGRTTNRIGEPGKAYAVWSHDEAIRNNVIAYNRDVQVAGWFVMPDVSHWPGPMQAQKLGKAPDAEQELPAGTDLDRLDKKPKGLSLTDLDLRLTSNLYGVKPGQRFYQWGCLWDACETYPSVEAVNVALGLDAGSRIARLGFQDWATLDLRVPADSPMVTMGCYPQGEVPGVRLGITGQ